MTTKLFFGIDPSLTGLAIGSSIGGFCRAETMAKEIGKLRGPERLVAIQHHIVKSLDELPRDPDLVAIEGYSYGSPNQAHQLGELGGLLRVTLYLRKLPTIIVPPTTLKKFITGKGNTKKNLMLSNVLKKWGYDAKDDNEADAFALVKLAEAYSLDRTAWPTIEVQNG